jgi:hypothetical protein
MQAGKREPCIAQLIRILIDTCQVWGWRWGMLKWCSTRPGRKCRGLYNPFLNGPLLPNLRQRHVAEGEEVWPLVSSH